jgi:DNA-directed RNA polymerase subunit RPC12/RpoP
METHKYKCNHCGYEKIILENSFDLTMSCDLCGGEMILENNERQTEEETVVDRLINEQLESEIKANGYISCWNIIETINKAETRARYRRHFFIVGGVIPDEEFIEDRNGTLFIKENKNGQ